MFLGYSARVYTNLWLNVQVLVDQLQKHCDYNEVGRSYCPGCSGLLIRSISRKEVLLLLVVMTGRSHQQYVYILYAIRCTMPRRA